MLINVLFESIQGFPVSLALIGFTIVCVINQTASQQSYQRWLNWLDHKPVLIKGQYQQTSTSKPIHNIWGLRWRGWAVSNWNMTTVPLISSFLYSPTIQPSIHPSVHVSIYPGPTSSSSPAPLQRGNEWLPSLRWIHLFLLQPSSAALSGDLWSRLPIEQNHLSSSLV